MWFKISRLIIRNRLLLVLLTIGFTAFFAWEARKLEINYEYAYVVPKDDPDMVLYKQFKSQFGEDGNILVVGFSDLKLYKIENFAKLQRLASVIQQIQGVNEVISIPTLKKLAKDTLNGQFYLKSIFKEEVQFQKSLDSLLSEAFAVNFYKGLIFNDSTKATLLAISLDKVVMNSPRRKELVESILQKVTDFSESTHIEHHLAGLPYLRYIMISSFKEEFNFLVVMSILVTCIILLVFFRSFHSVLFALLVIGITIVWTMGLTALLGFKISLLTGTLPALIVIISIPTCIYMFNKYHQEYRRHRNKMKAISRIVEKVGFITFLTNANTAVGFLVLYITDITVIKEFGLVAGIMSLATFLITLVVIPSLFVFLPTPSERQMMHLDKKTYNRILDLLSIIILRHRKWVYVLSIAVVGFSVYGLLHIKAIGFMADDMPERSNVKKDMAFFEKHFKGVMPLEILIDMGKKKAIYKAQNLALIDEFDAKLRQIPELSPSVSILSIVKSATQAFYNDRPEDYRVPSSSERNFILRYFTRKNNELSIIRSFVDSNAQVVRLSLKVADVGTERMRILLDNTLQRIIRESFEGSDFKIQVTGTSPIFLKGNLYLLNDLTESMIYAFILISVMMAFIFTDLRMIVISLIPNILPLLMTAGVMGLFDIRMKISTAVIFSISFGITIDSTIHYLSKFKQELAHIHLSITEAVIKSLKESGISMLYTGLVLICGFCIFMFSDYGGTQALGVLTVLTLFFSMLTNMILLPCLLITFVKSKVK